MLSKEKKEFISFMIASDVLQFGDFVTKSGRNTPYFINTGNYKTGKQIHTLGQYYANMINNTNTSFTAMFGPAYKGIPLVAAAANALYQQYQIDKPYFFNRKEIKDHGEGGNLIGYKPKPGDSVIIIEDVITAGTALREVLPILHQVSNLSVTDLFLSVDRCEVGKKGSLSAMKEIEEEFGIQVHACISVLDIKEYLQEQDSNKVKQMEAYMKQYCILD